ncbi:branched-chain amino acid ABC transporter permease [Candidatus Hikarchaeum yamanae]|uniref:branched-chain amino acid ABC transporter permease n=1 Tax=Candidatus Hikarchaeum yamanae TaxID=2675326 RepID=UPI0039EBBC13|tara:strand:- start:5629 stop:6921 length:1293 start_codon:yes stop_codon:yes gene_type:complete
MKFNREMFLKNDFRIVVSAFVGISFLFIIVAMILGLDFNGTVNTIQRIMFLSAVYAMVVLALNLQWGYAGIFNIGVAGFMLSGVYTMAIITGDPNGLIPGLGLPLPIGIIGGVLMASLLGLLISIPTLKLKADYLAIVTIGFAEIIRYTANALTFKTFSIAGVEMGTGAGRGIHLPMNPIRGLYYTDPSNLGLGKTVFGEYVFGLFEIVQVQSSVVVSWTYAIVLIFVVGLFYLVIYRIGNSPFGRVLKAIREDEMVANALGKNTDIYKIKVFAIGCGLMGLAGILWQGSYGYTNPTTFQPILTFYIFIALIIGGSGSNTGSIIGGVVFASLLFEGPNFVRRVVMHVFKFDKAPNSIIEAIVPISSLDLGPFVAYSLANISSLRVVFLGLVLIYIIQNRPEGLLGDRKELAASIDISRRPVVKTKEEKEA